MKITFNKYGLLILLVITLVLLLVGLFAPIITFKKFIFIQNTFSIISACVNLLRENQYFLFIVISLFSIVLPIVKLALLFKLVLSNFITSQLSRKSLIAIHQLGRWSMLDVFVIAILAVVVKLGAIADVEKHIGLYAYAGAAVLMMLITQKVIDYVEAKEAS